MQVPTFRCARMTLHHRVATGLYAYAQSMVKVVNINFWNSCRSSEFNFGQFKEFLYMKNYVKTKFCNLDTLFHIFIIIHFLNLNR